MYINIIRSRRKELGLSQSSLARLIGLAESNLSQLELGKRDPWPKVRKDLSRVLGMSEAELFSTTEKGRQDGD